MDSTKQPLTFEQRVAATVIGSLVAAAILSLIAGPAGFAAGLGAGGFLGPR